ncbi:MAG TPA: hypothetical protein QGG93_03495, partial [Verrucomicrobiota bacterium]|nr:hypothetical protein [Verrucomicrobiota bacterium]
PKRNMNNRFLFMRFNKQPRGQNPNSSAGVAASAEKNDSSQKSWLDFRFLSPSQSLGQGRGSALGREADGFQIDQKTVQFAGRPAAGALSVVA